MTVLLYVGNMAAFENYNFAILRLALGMPRATLIEKFLRLLHSGNKSGIDARFNSIMATGVPRYVAN
jgi:hypothetical protein